MQRHQRRTWISQPHHSPAYLAWLLREVESNDNQYLSQMQAQVRSLQIAEVQELRGEGLCAHGVGGADPETGRATRCALCRTHAIDEGPQLDRISDSGDGNPSTPGHQLGGPG